MIHIGLSGYSYPEWQGEGRFYPRGLKRDDFLKFYSSRFNALEGVGTWRHLPTEKMVAKWIEHTDADFRVTPKMHQKVTHLSRLKPEGLETLETFVRLLGPLEAAGKLGPTMLQLPPNMKRNDELLETFLGSIPHRPTLPWTMGFRHESWNAPEVEDILRRFGVGWVAEETEEYEAELRDTADHIYVRLRKDAYPEEALQKWAEFAVAKAAEGKRCYVFCKHQDAEAPWVWGDRLRELVGNT